jgi:hypothetical protein
VAGGIQSVTIPFNIRVVGKPTFLAPAQEVGTNYTELYSYSNFGMTYPLSLNLTRPEERSSLNSQKNFFMGIVIRSTLPSAILSLPSPTPPLASSNSGSGASGFAVTTDYLLTLGSATFGDPFVGTSRLLVIGALADQIAGTNGTLVSSGYCAANRNSITTGPGVTLQRIKSDGTPEYCNISEANANANLAWVTVRHNVLQNRPTVPTVTSTTLSRESAHPSLDLDQVNQEYRDFTASSRCSYCSIGPSVSLMNVSGGAISSYDSSSTSDALFSGNPSPHSGKTTRFKVDPVNNTIHREISDTSPSSAGFLDSYAQKGESLKVKATLSNNAPGLGLVARWYVNGCLKLATPVTAQDIEFPTAGSPPWILGDSTSGLNNDCSGQYERTEATTLSARLGYYKITLRLANGSEASNSTPNSSDNSPVGYDYVIRVVNTNPSPMLSMTDLRSRPVTGLTTSAFPVKQLLGFTQGSKPMFAYVEQQSSSSSTFRARELTEQGTLSPSTSINLVCASLSGEVNWIGVNQITSSSLQVALGSGSGKLGVGLQTAYPTSSTQSVYASTTHTCYHSNLSGFSVTQNNLANVDSASAAAKTLAFATLRQGSRTTSMRPNGANNGHLIDGGLASGEFWDPGYPMAGLSGSFDSKMFSSPQPELTGTNSDNTILKNMVEGGKLIQLIGADPERSPINVKGFVTLNSLSPSGRQLIASTDRSISMDTCSGFDAADLVKNPIPIDAFYHGTGDTLYVLATDTSLNAIGYLIEISGFMNGAGSCRVISKANTGPSRLEAPSRSRVAHNTSVQKLALDPNSWVLYGVISRGTGLPGQVFSYDLISKKPPIARTLSFAPTAILYSSGINAVHVLDGSYSANPATSPTLYRIW